MSMTSSEAHSQADQLSQSIPVGLPLLNQPGEVDGSQIAGLECKQRLFAAWIGGFDGSGDRVCGVDPVDEDQPWISSPPGGVGDQIHQFRCVQSPSGLAVPGVDQVQCATLPGGTHELIRCRHRDVEVLQEARLLLWPR